MIDAQTFDILNATYNLLQMSNTSLAHDCWLCLRMGPLLLSLYLIFHYPMSITRVSPWSITPVQLFLPS